MDDKSITLAQVLFAKERRWDRQKKLLQQYRRPLVCFTMNIAGPVKRTALSDFTFSCAMQQLRLRLSPIVFCEQVDDAAGCEGYFVVDADAKSIKSICMQMEQDAPVGRLYDLDVIAENAEKISRLQPRQCLLCEKPAALCARSRAHGLSAIKEKTTKILREFAQKQLAEFAVQSLLEEVMLTPKPGLVDQRNCGAHSDMDLAMFCRSAEALRSYFEEAVCLGMQEDDCMPRLQKAGIEAEKQMLAVTGGVNTHKGAIYAMGLLLAAMGGCLLRGGDVFLRAQQLALAAEPSAEQTHGAELRRIYGACGARQEAESGFQTARFAWADLQENRDDALGTFLKILLRCDDTNLLHRGGLEGLQFARASAEKILAEAPQMRDQMLMEMDDRMIERNLSPGGCADVLAQGIFLRKTEALWCRMDA